MFDVKLFGCLVPGDDGFWLICFLFYSKYRMIVGNYFDLRWYLFSPRGFVPLFEFKLLFLEQFWGTYTLVDGISKDKVVLTLWPNNFSAGEVLFCLGCKYRVNIVRKYYSELNFDFLKVHLTVWMKLSAKPFDWWQWGLIVLSTISQVFENERNLWLENSGPLSSINSLDMPNFETTFLHLLIIVSDWGYHKFCTAINFQ